MSWVSQPWYRCLFVIRDSGSWMQRSLAHEKHTKLDYVYRLVFTLVSRWFVRLGNRVLHGEPFPKLFWLEKHKRLDSRRMKIREALMCASRLRKTDVSEPRMQFWGGCLSQHKKLVYLWSFSSHRIINLTLKIAQKRGTKRGLYAMKF